MYVVLFVCVEMRIFSEVRVRVLGFGCFFEGEKKIRVCPNLKYYYDYMIRL